MEDKLEIIDGFIIAWTFRDCAGRTSDDNFMAKVEAHADEVRAAVRRYLTKGSGAKTDTAVTPTESRARMLRTLEEAYLAPTAGARRE